MRSLLVAIVVACVTTRVMSQDSEGPKCGNSTYDAQTQICCDDSVATKASDYKEGDACCNGVTFDSTSHKCCGYFIPFNPKTHVCCASLLSLPESKVVAVKKETDNACCGGEPYDDTKDQCCSQKFTVIKTKGENCGKISDINKTKE